MKKRTLISSVLFILLGATLYNPAKAQSPVAHIGLPCGDKFGILCPAILHECTSTHLVAKIQPKILSEVKELNGVYTITYRWSNTAPQVVELYIEIALPYSLPIISTLTTVQQNTLRSASFPPNTVSVNMVLFDSTLEPICASTISTTAFVFAE
jgi:hypothetical protein